MPKWEYGELILYVDAPDSRGTGCSFHSHTLEGNKETVITKGVLLGDEGEATAHWDKFSEAVAKLGLEGWELSGVVNYNPPSGVNGVLHWFRREIK